MTPHDAPRMHIGEVAALTGLSLRTIRFYEEVGLLGPTSRSPGGFRMYAEADVARLEVVKQMKPLEFTVEQMRDLLGVLDELGTHPTAGRRAELLGRLGTYRTAAQERVVALRSRLEVAETFEARLQEALDEHGARRTGSDGRRGRTRTPRRSDQ